MPKVRKSKSRLQIEIDKWDKEVAAIAAQKQAKPAPAPPPVLAAQGRSVLIVLDPDLNLLVFNELSKCLQEFFTNGGRGRAPSFSSTVKLLIRAGLDARSK